MITVEGSKDNLLIQNPKGPSAPGGPVRYDQPQDSTFVGESNRNHLFNEICYSVFDNPSFLDIGCAGGGFIADVLDDGFFGIGLDGFPMFKKNKIDGWSKYPSNFHELNIAKPFAIYENNNHVLFSIITAWEVMEHLFEDEIAPVAHNILNNLKDDGIVVLSISSRPSPGHFSIKPLKDWIDIFEGCGFVLRSDLESTFPSSSWVRRCGDSYTLFLSKK